MHNAPVSVPPNTFALETKRRIVRIQALTLVWMSVEAVVSLGAAWMARSPALLGFGGDSAVELMSAAVVLWRFHSPSRRVSRLRLSGANCFGGSRRQCDLEGELGRPHRRLGPVATDCA